MKKILTAVRSIPDRIYNKAVLLYRNIETDGKLTVNGRLYVTGHGKIRIGKDVIINSSLSSNPIGGDCRTILALKDTAQLFIGDRAGISNTAIVCHQKITIGARTMVGGGTKIYDTNFHSLDYRERGDYAHENAAVRPVHIGEDVFIGGHCIILKGVTIGDRSIVAAGSVVTKDIPPGEVWGGNPARKIR